MGLILSITKINPTPTPVCIKNNRKCFDKSHLCDPLYKNGHYTHFCHMGVGWLKGFYKTLDLVSTFWIGQCNLLNIFTSTLAKNVCLIKKKYMYCIFETLKDFLSGESLARTSSTQLLVVSSYSKKIYIRKCKTSLFLNPHVHYVISSIYICLFVVWPQFVERKVILVLTHFDQRQYDH